MSERVSSEIFLVTFLTIQHWERVRFSFFVFAYHLVVKSSGVFSLSSTISSLKNVQFQWESTLNLIMMSPVFSGDGAFVSFVYEVNSVPL